MKLQARETPSEPRIGETVRTRLASIAKRARNDKGAKFYSINHLMNKATLREAFRRQSNKAAPGIDGRTKE
jgi:RNA-directed DNA polymerase